MNTARLNRLIGPVLALAIVAILTLWHTYHHVFSFDIPGVMGGYIHGDILLLLVGMIICGALYVVAHLAEKSAK